MLDPFEFNPLNIQPMSKLYAGIYAACPIPDKFAKTIMYFGERRAPEPFKMLFRFRAIRENYTEKRQKLSLPTALRPFVFDFFGAQKVRVRSKAQKTNALSQSVKNRLLRYFKEIAC